jgi:pSer/pThr/pTyr-binding forkhead associated (FHA) protein
MFVLSDQGSSNGTFLNDQQIATPQPLVSGDRIRLYGPELLFSAVELDAHAPTTTPQDEATVLPSALEANTVQSVAYLLFLNGAQKDLRVPLAMKELRIGRATQNHTWEVGVQDSTVSRPHARLQNVDGAWTVQDLGSSNGTMVNGNRLTEKPKILIDSDIITVGSTMLQYRIGR